MKRYIAWMMTALMGGCGTYEDALKQVPLLEADAEAGRAVYAQYGCAGCHGEDGSVMALGVSRIIAEIATQRDIENALFALRAPDALRDDVMKGVALGLTPQEMTDVAAFIATLKP